MQPRFRPYREADREDCLSLFDANCPTFFLPNERREYQQFLDHVPDGYEVCEIGERVVAAFGLISRGNAGLSLNWIMLHPESQGIGIGSAIMKRIIALGRATPSKRIDIAASQKSAPFFARFGAVAAARTKDGWGPGMDRVDMELAV